MYIIPAPQKLERTAGSFLVRFTTWITLDVSCSEQVKRQAGLFQKSLEKNLGYELLLTRGKGRKGDILVKQDDSMEKESYTLIISEDGVVLTGEESGIWHGMQTILQIAAQKGGRWPSVNISDKPDLPNRGYYFDCARGRVPKLSWLKQLADRMAYYKRTGQLLQRQRNRAGSVSVKFWTSSQAAFFQTVLPSVRTGRFRKTALFLPRKNAPSYHQRYGPGKRRFDQAYDYRIYGAFYQQKV